MTQQELIDDLVRQAEIRRLQPGEVLYPENEESREAFVAIDGSAEVIVNDDLVVATHGALFERCDEATPRGGGTKPQSSVSIYDRQPKLDSRSESKPNRE